MHRRAQEPSILAGSMAAGLSWFAVQTKPRHEKRAAAELEEKGVVVFLPLHAVIRQWSDRKRKLQLPLFPNYLFVRVRADRGERIAVLGTNAIVRFVGKDGGVSIPDEEIEAVSTLLKTGVPFEPCPFGTVGQRVRIRGGSLDGVQGTVVKQNDGDRLIVSVECIQRSLAIELHGYSVEPYILNPGLDSAY
jgi:transcription antitermination factor NusG